MDTPLKRNFASFDNISELQYISPWLLIILADVVLWAKQRSLPVVITSIVREEDDGISESTTHQEGRAIDLSVRGWSQANIENLAKYLNDKYGKKIGTSPAGKPTIVCKYHNNGNGWHFHLQVRRIIEKERTIQIS